MGSWLAVSCRGMLCAVLAFAVWVPGQAAISVVPCVRARSVSQGAIIFNSCRSAPMCEAR